MSYAAEGGDVEVVAKLVELGAEVDGADKVRVRMRVKARGRFISYMIAYTHQHAKVRSHVISHNLMQRTYNYSQDHM